MTKILGESVATPQQMAAYLLSVNPTPRISVGTSELCRLFVEVAAQEGVRGDVLFAQSCHETGNFSFPRTVSPSQNNFSGLGTTDDNTPGAIFPDAATGILAQAQHAKAYATTDPLRQPCVDPRYTLLIRYGKAGTAQHLEDLGGKWAVPGYDPGKYVSLEAANEARDSYGYRILKILEKILRMPGAQQESVGGVEIPVSVRKTTRYQTKNGAYTCGRQIDVKGIILHSYGFPQPDPNVLARAWDNPTIEACVHAHIGKEEIIVTLPCEEVPGRAAEGWHAGGSANKTHLSAEMTDPSTIKYVGGANWVELADGTNTRAHVLATYQNTVELFALWCVIHNLDPLEDGVILSHSEAYRRGIASNHADVEHLWSKFGLSMNQFRRDVKAAMVGVKSGVETGIVPPSTSVQSVKPLSGALMVIYDGLDGMNLRRHPDYNAEIASVAYRCAYFRVVGISEDEQWYKLDNGLYISAIPDYVAFVTSLEQKVAAKGTGYYRVRADWADAKSQIGAFKALENALSLARNNPGYKVYDNDGKQIYS